MPQFFVTGDIQGLEICSGRLCFSITFSDYFHQASEGCHQRATAPVQVQTSRHLDDLYEMFREMGALRERLSLEQAGVGLSDVMQARTALFVVRLTVPAELLREWTRHKWEDALHFSNLESKFSRSATERMNEWSTSWYCA